MDRSAKPKADAWRDVTPPSGVHLHIARYAGVQPVAEIERDAEGVLWRVDSEGWREAPSVESAMKQSDTRLGALGWECA